MPLDTLVSSPARLAPANRGKGIQENQFLSYRLDSLSLRAFGPSAGNDTEFWLFETFFNGVQGQPNGSSVSRQRDTLMRSLRIPTKPAMHSNMKPATYSDPKPAGVPI